MSARARAGLTLALGLVCCASPIPLEQREWFALRTAHYDIVSSIGDDETRLLAVELERFRGAVGHIRGGVLPDEPARTRVYAFDDRSFPRKFAYQRRRSFLLPRQRGDVIVLRTGGGWEDDAWTALKLDYARRLLWNASADAPPPWLDEGLPQLASAVVVRGKGAVVDLRDDHVHSLREQKWIPFERLLAAEDLAGWSNRDRAVFEAESWAICHYLMLGPKHQDSAAQIERFRALLREGASPAAAAETALGGPAQNAVYRHVVRNQFDTAKLKLPLRGPEPALRPVSFAEVLTELGELSLAIGENAQARRYLERALEEDQGSARALAGLGAAHAAQRDFAGAEQRYRAALAAAPDDALTVLGVAHLFAARASVSAAAERAELVREARDHYRKTLALAGELPEARAGLAATYLLEGEDPAQGRAALRAARAALPGDAELAQLDVHLAIAEDNPGDARRIATLVVTRARSTSELAAARDLLDQIEVLAAMGGARR